jgi:hypothetical protein
MLLLHLLVVEPATHAAMCSVALCLRTYTNHHDTYVLHMHTHTAYTVHTNNNSAEPWFCFSPVKNSLQEGKDAQAQGTPAACAATGEADQYFLWGEMLRLCGCSVTCAPKEKWAGALHLYQPFQKLSKQ